MISSKNTGTPLLVIDIGVNQPHGVRFLPIGQDGIMKHSKLSATTLDDWQAVLKACGPGVTPSGIPTGREAEPATPV